MMWKVGQGWRLKPGCCSSSFVPYVACIRVSIIYSELSFLDSDFKEFLPAVLFVYSICSRCVLYIQFDVLFVLVRLSYYLVGSIF